MPTRALFEQMVAEEGWSERTQIELLLRYIENQDSAPAFEDFLAGMRSEDADGNAF